MAGRPKKSLEAKRKLVSLRLGPCAFDEVRKRGERLGLSPALMAERCILAALMLDETEIEVAIAERELELARQKVERLTSAEPTSLKRIR